MSRTPGWRRSPSSAADTRLPGPGRLPRRARQGPGSLGCRLPPQPEQANTSNAFRPAQQPGPIQARRARLARLLHRRGKGRPLLLQPRLLPHLREQKWPHFRAWSEDAVEPREVCPRRRHQRRQATEQLQPGEEEVRGAIRQRALHPPGDAAVLGSRQALQRQSAARPVAAEPLQSLPVVGVQVRVGVQGEALQQEGAPGLLSGLPASGNAASPATPSRRTG